MAEATRVNSIDFPPFFSVDPVDGLMVASRKKEKYEDGDVLAELFTTKFGRELELGFLGGFANGIRIKTNKVQDFSNEDIKKMGSNSHDDLECIVNRPDILVYTKLIFAEGQTCKLYFLITPHGMLSCDVITSAMSRAEADFYHKLFSSARAFGSSTASKTANSSNTAAATPVSNLKAEGDQLVSTYLNDIAEIQSRFSRSLNDLYMECNYSDVSNMYRVRSRFRSQVNTSGRELSWRVLKLSDDGEKLVKRGADTAFIRKMIQTFRSAQGELELEVNVDTGGYGDWDIKYTIPSDVEALPAKWEQILNNHPDIAAERLAEARQSETKRVTGLIQKLKKEISVLQVDEPSRRHAAEIATNDFENSVSTLEKRIAEINTQFDQEILQLNNQLNTLKQQKTDCEKLLQQTQDEHQKTFFLAFGKKKALLLQIGELTAQLSQYGQQIIDQGRQIDVAEQNRANKVEHVQQSHANLKKAMNKAKDLLARLPSEIKSAEAKLTNAQQRLEQIPNMSLKELNAHSSI